MSMSVLSYCVALTCLVSAVSAFGAGNIPSYGALEGVAFRHGDIEDILLQLALVPSGSGTGGFLSNFNPLSSAGKKFNAMAVKRVYFGNWLRDYSQAVDVGTLSKGLDSKTIRLLVWVMGFMAFGYATEEFEVTDARLGVYRPEEHIDNPKGYPNPEEPDARKYDPRLRGPVQQVELEIDPESGMKNYIANERGGWMTSSSYVRNSLNRSIELGRAYKQSGNEAEKYESLRVLGQALHTLEDFSAHSNFCELVLLELGFNQVFPQVGTATSIRLSNGKSAFPLTTGTFGGLDFVHSLLGEATDKISQTQINEVASGLATSSTQGSSGLLSTLQSLSSNVPGFSMNRELDEMQAVSREADAMRNGSQSRATSSFSIGTDADEIARKIYPVMAFRDRFMKGLSAFFEKIPGLSSLIDQISETLTVWVLSTIEPFMKPIVEKVTGALGAGQSLVTSKDDQLAVFENPHSSDPTHSMLAKDHFSCYLNHPAGLIGQAVVKHVVTRVTAAWSDFQINPAQIIDEILEVFHHPALSRGRTTIQREMRSIVEQWANSLGQKRQKVLNGLSFEGVKQGLHHEGGSSATTGASATHGSCHTNSGPARMSGYQSQAPSGQAYASQSSAPMYSSSVRPSGGHNSSHASDNRHSHGGNGSHRPQHGQAQHHSGAASSYYNDQPRSTSHSYNDTQGFGNQPSQGYDGPQGYGDRPTESSGSWTSSQQQNYDTPSAQAYGHQSFSNDSGYQQGAYGAATQSNQEAYGRPTGGFGGPVRSEFYGQGPPPGPPEHHRRGQFSNDSGDWTQSQAPSDSYGGPPQQDPRYGSSGYGQSQNYGRDY